MYRIGAKLFRTNLRQIRLYSQDENPFQRSWRVLSTELSCFFGLGKTPNIYPEHVDIVIIGGGYIGASVAYWLKTRAGEGLSVVVLEKDCTYKNVPKNFNDGELHQHYSLPENILLAKYSADFFRNLKQNLETDIDIQFRPSGNLVLASEKYAHKLEQNILLQRELGVKNELLNVDDISWKYPWLNTDDIKLGCRGIEREGTFNSWHLLRGLVERTKQLGVTYVNAEVIDFEFEKQRDMLMEGVKPGTFERITKVVYKTPDNETYAIKFAICVLAAGGNSGQIAKLAKIGIGDDLLLLPLTVQSRQSKMFTLEDNKKITKMDTPYIMDTSGLWLRKLGIGNTLLCGSIPSLTGEESNLSDSEYISHMITPMLKNRVPAFENIDVNHFLTSTNDCNTYDESGVIGPHPYHCNLYFGCGFGTQGCVHAPGIGRAIVELIIDNQFTSIDLTRFQFDRFLINEPLTETNIY